MTVEEALRAQLRNIETATGRSIADWTDLIRATGLTRHGQIVAWLKETHGMSHGTAHRLALTALDALRPAEPTAEDPVAALYTGPRDALRPIHERLMAAIHANGADIEVAPKKGYLSIRRRKQFAMLKPAARHVDLGLVLPGAAVTDRLESAATFNALFSHRVRVRSVDDVDAQLIAWIRDAYGLAG